MSAFRRLARTIATIALAFASAASFAATNIYGIRGTPNNIYRIDATTGAATTVYTGYPGGTALAMAQCPNGLIYYVASGSPFQLHVFNPQTPSVAPVTLGSGLGTQVYRMACSPAGTLYFLSEASSNNLGTINTTTGAVNGSAVTVTNTGTQGDIAFKSDGTLWLLNTNNNLGKVPLAGGALDLSSSGTGSISGTNSGGGQNIGLAFDASDTPYALTTGSPNNFYSINQSSRNATGISSTPGGNTDGDLASASVANPDLSIAVSSNTASVTPSTATSVTLTITATNSGATAVTGTIADAFPASFSGIAWTCVASSGSTCAAASGSGNIATTATLAASGTATYTVTATVNASAPASDTATIALPFAYLTDATPANNTASTTIAMRPTVTKTFGTSSIVPGGSTSLTISLGNANAGAITLSSALTDTFPTSPGAMTIATAGNTGTCSGVTAPLGAGSVTMANGSSIPSGGCTIVVTVKAGATGAYTNTIAAGDLSTSSGTNAAAASATLTVAGPVFTIVKSAQVLNDPYDGSTNPKAIPGAVVAYTVTVTNTGSSSPDADATAVSDAIPTNTQLYVGNLGAPSGPVAFTNQGSGLTYTYTSLSSSSDDLSFSNTDCTTFTYTPTADANGYDANVKCIRVNPKGTFAANGGTPPAFQLQFRVRIN